MVIGGLGANEGNRIDHNLTGIQIDTAGVKYNWVAGNIIAGHPQWGIYIHGYASHNFIVYNYLTGNTTGIWVREGANNSLRANAISGNQPPGIMLTDGGNQMLAAPVITELTEFHIAGKACPGCVVEIFSDPGDQGYRYEGSTIADQAGNFQYAKRLYGPNVTATATDFAGNTSQFSSPSAIAWSWINLYLPLIMQNYP
jgi:parallel beta-helix repeat protein